MTPEQILNKKNATKTELRKALAEALAIAVPVFEKASEDLKTDCRNIWENVFFENSGFEFIWDAKQNKHFSELITKISSLLTSKNELDIRHSFEAFLQKTPQWYKKNAFSPAVLNAKFNDIINSIKNEKRTSITAKTGVSQQYLAKIAGDL